MRRLCIQIKAKTQEGLMRLHGKIGEDTEARRNHRGDIIAVYDADKQGMFGADGELQFRRIYILDWNGSLVEAQSRYCGPHMEGESTEWSQPVLIAMSKNVVTLPPRLNKQMEDDGYLDMSTAQFERTIRVRQPHSRNFKLGTMA